MALSFAPDQVIYVGRSKRCALRLDSADISGEHARVGFEGGQFWVEDLGSTNGTFVASQQVSGRQNVAPGTPIVLGREVVIIGVTSEEQVRRPAGPDSAAKSILPAEQEYPVLVSTSELVRPSRVALRLGANISMGRDPSCEFWIGAPHVSRRHCSFSRGKQGIIRVTDHSTNGVAFAGGMLRREEPLELDGSPQVFDFGGGVTIALCYDAAQEQQFLQSKGSFSAFRPPSVTPQIAPSMVQNLLAEGAAGGDLAGAAPTGLRRQWRNWHRLSATRKLLMVLLLVFFVIVLIVTGSLIFSVMV